GPVPGPVIVPYQPRRIGQPSDSAVRLNRSWMRSAQTTPQWSRNQSQVASTRFRALLARVAHPRAVQMAAARHHGTKTQSLAPAWARSVLRVSAAYSQANPSASQAAAGP